MRHFFFLFLHELRMLLIAPSTYVASFLFLLLMGFFYWYAIHEVSLGKETMLPSILFFSVFFVPVLFTVPLLTMRSIADERRMGTLESLMTTPVSALEIVLSKFLGAYVFYLTLWGATLGFPLLAYYSLPGHVDERLLDTVSLGGGYLFVAVSGTLYIALGLFASSLTRTQLVAGMLSLGLLVILFVSGYFIDNVDVLRSRWTGFAQVPVDYLKTFSHLEDFSRGVVDTRPFFFYFSGTVMMLSVTTLIVEARR